MLTSAIVSKYPNLVIEDLRITNMVQNKKLARRILEQSWGTFRKLLEYKAVSASGHVISVSPRNTSGACSDCGRVKEDTTTIRALILVSGVRNSDRS